MKKETGLFITAGVCLMFSAGLILSPFPKFAPDNNYNNIYYYERDNNYAGRDVVAEVLSGRSDAAKINGENIAVKAVSNGEKSRRAAVKNTRKNSDSFIISLEDASGNFDAEFLKLSSDSVAPKDWDMTRFLFLSGQGVYLACTDMGIWRLDPETRTAVKLSADVFQGRTRAEIQADTGKTVFWTDDPVLSPNGRYLAYVSNRTDPESDGDEIWTLDTATGEEHLLMRQKGTWKTPLGFLSEKDILIEIEDKNNNKNNIYYAAADAVTGDISEIECNIQDGTRVQDVSPNGHAAMIDYKNHDLIILRIGAKGKILERMDFTGNYPAGVKFSPSGGRLAAPIADESDQDADAVLLIDIRTGNSQRLDGGSAGNQIRDYAWANESSLLIDIIYNINNINNINQSGVTWLYHCDAK